MPDLLLRNVRPMGGPTTDVLIEAGRFKAFGSDLATVPGTVIDGGGGALMLPGLVEAHTHLEEPARPALAFELRRAASRPGRWCSRSPTARPTSAAT